MPVINKQINKMRKFGLIGKTLSHSFSKGYFTNKFSKEGIQDCSYDNYPIESINDLPHLIENNKQLLGLNVTIPYKEEVLSLLNEIDSDAKEIGAVNTVKIERTPEGSVNLKGFNTDVYGFRKPLEEVIMPTHKKALILGTGGASKAVAWVLESLGIDFSYVSRNPKTDRDFAYGQLTSEDLSGFKLIINTSPIGMYPKVKEAPNLPYCGLSKEHILYDLVYNPELTRFLKKGKEKKATLINGLPMLYLQAEKSWEIWNTD